MTAREGITKVGCQTCRLKTSVFQVSKQDVQMAPAIFNFAVLAVVAIGYYFLIFKAIYLFSKNRSKKCICY